MGLTNTQYDALMRMYSQRQLEARHEQEKRREEAYAAIPAHEDLDREAGAASLARARVLLGGDDSAPAGGNAVISAEGLRSALADISARRARLLLPSPAALPLRPTPFWLLPATALVLTHSIPSGVLAR